jgi:N-acetylglucosaminyldiphosphoundecaprenol N-acetyl-beta-D-mannosaminyltransferase
MESLTLLHLRLHSGRMDEFLALAEEAVARKKVPLRMLGVNPYIFMLARLDSELAAAVNRADLVNIDGISLVWCLRLYGHPVPERVACPDLLERLLVAANEKRWRVFFLGATPQCIARLVTKVALDFPSLVIAGTHHGYFDLAEEPRIVKEIESCRADLLLVGMPSPQKELFIDRNAGKIGVPLSFGVGGMFDVLAGTTRRAPLLMRRLGLEWLCRLVQEPAKMFPRDMRTVAFVLLMLKGRRWRQQKNKR